MLEPLPTSDAALDVVPEPADAPPVEAPASGDAYVDQLRTLLLKATERARAAEHATEALQRELASVRARLAEELASTAVLTEMAGEAERRAMKAEATAEALRAHLAGERPVPPIGQGAGDVRVPPSARQQLDGLVRELHSAPTAPAVPVGAPAAVVVPPPVSPVAPAAEASWTPPPEPAEDEDDGDDEVSTPILTARRALAAAARPSAGALPSPRPGRSSTPEPSEVTPVPGATVTILPTASSRRRWGR